MTSKEETDSSKGIKMRFKSSTKTVKNYIDEKVTFKIPAFQRPYSWSGKDVIKLINDAINQKDAGHFIGAFIISKNENSNEAIIIDGQQRLTSILLVMCAIRDWNYKTYKVCCDCKESAVRNDHKICENRKKGEECNSTNGDQIGEEYNKIRKFIRRRIINNNLDDDLLEGWDVLLAGQSRALDWWKLFSEIVYGGGVEKNKILTTYGEVYRFLEGKFENDSEYIELLYSSIKKLIFTEISSCVSVDAYYVFRSLNSSGVSLKVNDHVKAHLFSLLDDNEENVLDRTDGSYINSWNIIKNNVEYSLDNHSIDVFIKNFAKVNRLNAGVVNDVYEAYFASITTSLGAQNCLNEMLKDSEIYREIVKPDVEDKSNSLQLVRSDLRLLEDIKIKQHVQLVYAAYKLMKVGGMTVKQLQNLTSFLAKYLFVYHKLAALPGNKLTSKYNKYSKKFIEFIDGVESLSTTKNSLSTTKNLVSTEIQKLKKDFNKVFDAEPSHFERAKVNLYSIDYENDKPFAGYVLRYCFPEVLGSETFEHVVPQSSGMENVHKIGNLIYLTEDHNRELLNSSVPDKVKKYKTYQYIPKHFIKIISMNSENLNDDDKFSNFRMHMANKMFEIFASDLGYVGEYQAADEYCYAQNVPKPNVPEDGYRDKTPDGLLKTMDAWNQWINYGVQTGDYSKAREFLSSSNDGELKIYKEIEALYQRGGWVIDGIEHFEPVGIPWSDDGQTYYLKTNHEWDKQTKVEPDGRQETRSNKEEEVYKFAFEHDTHKWQILYSRIEA